MIRSYDASRAVPTEVVEQVLAAALRAPSAGHAQGVSFLLLHTPVETAGYWNITARPGEHDRWLRGMRTAPVLILVWTSAESYLDRYAQPDKGWFDRDPARWSAPYWYVDAGMAGMATLLAAVDHELGACFFGVPPDRVGAVREAYGVPPDQLSVGVISLGYPDPAQPGQRPSARAARAGRVHVGHWFMEML